MKLIAIALMLAVSLGANASGWKETSFTDPFTDEIRYFIEKEGVTVQKPDFPYDDMTVKIGYQCYKNHDYCSWIFIFSKTPYISRGVHQSGALGVLGAFSGDSAAGVSYGEYGRMRFGRGVTYEPFTIEYSPSGVNTIRLITIKGGVWGTNSDREVFRVIENEGRNYMRISVPMGELGAPGIYAFDIENFPQTAAEFREKMGVKKVKWMPCPNKKLKRKESCPS